MNEADAALIAATKTLIKLVGIVVNPKVGDLFGLSPGEARETCRAAVVAAEAAIARVEGV